MARVSDFDRPELVVTGSSSAEDALHHAGGPVSPVAVPCSDRFAGQAHVIACRDDGPSCARAANNDRRGPRACSHNDERTGACSNDHERPSSDDDPDNYGSADHHGTSG